MDDRDAIRTRIIYVYRPDGAPAFQHVLPTEGVPAHVLEWYCECMPYMYPGCPTGIMHRPMV